MNQPTQALEHASVRQYCKALRMPVIGGVASTAMEPRRGLKTPSLLRRSLPA